MSDKRGSLAGESSNEGGENKSVRNRDEEGRKSIRNPDGEGRKSIRIQDEEGRKSIRIQDEEGRKSIRIQDEERRKSSRIPDDESRRSSNSPYNPFEHRNVKKPMSDFEALVHMLKTSLGSGILAMPMAFKNSGLVGGSLGTITLGVVCTHCIYMLVDSAQTLCYRNKVPTLTFQDATQKAFENGPPAAKKSARSMRITVVAQLLGSFTLGNSVYVVFMSASLQQVFDYWTEVGLQIRYYTLMVWLPLILLSMVRNLKTLAPFSLLANLLVLLCFTIVLYYIFKDINKCQHASLISPFSRWPFFLTTILFALEGVGTVMAIENEMHHPEHFVKGRFPVAIVAMTIVVTVYSLVGFFGYLRYGEEVKGSVTLNLPVTETLAQFVYLGIAMALFFTYALQFYVPINLTCDLVNQHISPEYHFTSSILIRIVMVSLTVITALAIPNLEPIISLVGAICFSVLGLMMPSLIDTMTRYPHWGPYKWRLVKNIIIVGISLITLVAGTLVSIEDIIVTYTGKGL